MESGLRMLQLGSWAIALICGSMGVFCLWFSYLSAQIASYAAEFMLAAIAVEWARHHYFPTSKRS
jgi:hypothetical protein